VTDWTALPGFPRTYPGECAPWTSSVRFVDGARELKNGKTVTISGTKAFLQRLEIDLITGRAAAPDIPTLLDSVLDAHARHIDRVEWCRVRDDELDLCLRVYAARGEQRVHVALRGPIGRFADRPLPVHPADRPKKTRPVAAPPPVRPRERLPPPAAANLLRPIAPAATPSHGDPIARDLDGRVHVVVRQPGGDAWAVVDPTGVATLTSLTPRDAIRTVDVGAMTGAMLAGVHTTADGLVRIDHYDRAGGMQERVHHAGRCHAGRRGLWDADWTLGVHADWFLRCIVHHDTAILLGVHLATGKRARIALPDIDLRGAAVDRTPDGPVLRLLHAGTEERRSLLRFGRAVVLEPAATIPLTLTGQIQPVPDGGWLVADARALRLLRPDRTTHLLFTLPASFTGDYAPWGPPNVTQVGFDAGPAWLVDLDFGADDRPRCRGALVFTADGAVRGLAYTDAAGVLRLNAATLPFAEGEHVCGLTAGPTGDLAAALALADGLALLWAPGGAPPPT
jgi:hypothetical protein